MFGLLTVHRESHIEVLSRLNIGRYLSEVHLDFNNNKMELRKRPDTKKGQNVIPDDAIMIDLCGENIKFTKVEKPKVSHLVKVGPQVF